jgi:hypothetical protein
LGIDAVTFGTGDEAVERGVPLGGDVMSGKQPVLCSDPTRRRARLAVLRSMLRKSFAA